VIPLPVAMDVTPCPSLVALIVIVSPDLTVVTLVPAAIVSVSLLLFAVAVPPELAVKFLNIFCDDPLSVLVRVPVLVIVPPDNPVLVAIDVTPALLDVPAPIRFLTSVALIPLFKVGVEPLDKIAGVPVSFTTPKLVLAPDAVLDPVPPFATDKSVPDQFPLLILTDPPKVIVPVEVIVPPVNVIPFTDPDVATEVTPALELVPAPIKFLTSVAVIPEFKLGTVPLDKIAGVPVSFTTPKLVLAADAVLAPVPPLATDKSVPDQSPPLIESVPPKVIVPVDVIVPPVSVKPFTDPAVATDVTPELLTAPIKVLIAEGLLQYRV